MKGGGFIKKININQKVPFLISENLARLHNVIPIDIKEGNLIVASENKNIYAYEDIKLATGMNVEFEKLDNNIIKENIDYYYNQTNQTSSSYIAKIFDNILKQSIIENASDIHIEPNEDSVDIRIRVDGHLKKILTYSHDVYNQLATLIKLTSNMDIAEKRLPQDGRVGKSIDKVEIDLRVSSIPVIYGEKLVIRLLDRNNFLKEKTYLGFNQQSLMLLDKIIKKQTGILLITGPTGSGKTTTLYSVLKDLMDINKNIVTIEDPVEYKLTGINQIQVNNKIGLNFASGLRAILRQDPDIIMVGEIRDVETAQIAIRAAITGHLVISTIHTNDAVSAINRLIDMGIEPYLISSALIGVIAQRLVRKLCNKCKQEKIIKYIEKDILKINEDIKIAQKSKCINCDSKGYKGRVAIYEILEIDSDIRKKILETQDSNDIKEYAIKKGMKTLKDSCKDLVIDKMTTLDEYMTISYMNT